MVSENRFEIRSGGGFLMLFGLPFFCAGCFIIYSGSTGQMMSSSGGAAPLLFVIPFGGIFASVGGGLMFGRRGKIIDGDSRTVTSWWGLMVPFKKTVYSFDDIGTVTVTKEVRRSDKSSYTCYPVRLVTSERSVELEAPRNYHKARQQAEAAAKIIQIPMDDTGGGKRVLRQPDELDESVKDRILKSGDPLEIPEQPDGSRVQYRADGEALVLDLPPPGFNLMSYIMIGSGVIFPLIVGVFFLPRFLSGTSGVMRIIPLVFIGVFFIGMPLIVTVGVSVWRATQRSQVTVSSQGLVVRHAYLIGSRTLDFPVDELEELDVKHAATSGQTHPMFAGLGAAVTAQSDKRSATFGAGLSDADLEWLHQIIKYVLATKT